MLKIHTKGCLFIDNKSNKNSNKITYGLSPLYSTRYFLANWGMLIPFMS